MQTTSTLSLRLIMLRTSWGKTFLKVLSPHQKRERLLTSHMEIETTKAVLMAQDLSKVENAVLIHLSDRNSDERRFVEEVKGVTGKVIIAGKDRMGVNFNK